MFIVPRNQLQHFYSSRIFFYHALSVITSQSHSSFSNTIHDHSSFSNSIHDHSTSVSPPKSPTAPFRFSFIKLLNASFPKQLWVSFYSSRTYRGPLTRSLRKRIRKREIAATKPVLNEAQFQRAISQLPPRFTSEELHNVMTLQDDPLVCLELFNWASHQHRFRHNLLTYHITIKVLGAAKMYQEMDDVVNQVLAIPNIGSEALYNTMIYYFIEARKLIRAINIYKHMRDGWKFDCRPSIRTYNILFTALLSRGKNSYINHVYMETIRRLFKQMVDDGVEPDIFSLNSMIKGYVISFHVNDALRIFHQIGVVYNCQPNSFSYNYLIHGLCAQGRTNNASELFEKMKEKGYIPSSKSYNSLVNSLALEGKVDEAVKFLLEMGDNQRSADFITYLTVFDEICRQKKVGDAMMLLEELQEKNHIDEHTYKKLLCELKDDFCDSNVRIQTQLSQHKYLGL